LLALKACVIFLIKVAFRFYPVVLFSSRKAHRIGFLFADGSMQFGDFRAEIDLHGERVEEGLERLERFLDQAMLSIESDVTVIHGHGSGRLKQAVRHYLKHSPYISQYRPGEPWEGGDGVTIAQLDLRR